MMVARTNVVLDLVKVDGRFDLTTLCHLCASAVASSVRTLDISLELADVSALNLGVDDATLWADLGVRSHGNSDW